MYEPTLMGKCPHYKKYHCNRQMIEIQSQWREGTLNAAISHPKFTVKTALGTRSCNSIVFHASLLQAHSYCQTWSFSTFHTTFKWKFKGLPFISSTFSHITLGNFPISSQITFLAAPPKIFSLAIGLLPGNHKIRLSVLLPAQGSLTQHSQQCFAKNFHFSTFFSKSVSCRFLLLMFVYFTAYKQLRSNSQFP